MFKQVSGFWFGHATKLCIILGTGAAHISYKATYKSGELGYYINTTYLLNYLISLGTFLY